MLVPNTTMEALLATLTNGAQPGTGVKPLLAKASKLLGGSVPQYLIDAQSEELMAMFGLYPTSVDKAPLILFAVLFGIFAIAHLGVWGMNLSRGHKFHLLFGFAFYNVMRLIGFALRAKWSSNIVQIDLGIACEVFLISPPVLLASLNLVLAQRVFTWRHPKGGDLGFFWAYMIGTYALVVGVVVMLILGGAIPFLYFLGHYRYQQCKGAFAAAAVFNLLYSANAIGLISLAYLFKPTTKDQNTMVYQPWWIQSFSTFYYPPKNANKVAAETFAARDHHARYAVRVMPSHVQHYNTVLEIADLEETAPPSLLANHSIYIVTFLTVLLFAAATCRCISAFGNKTWHTETNLHKPVVMYVLWGAFETIINVMYLVFRVDLRFYKPDRLPKNIQAQTAMMLPKPADIQEKASESSRELR